MKKFTIKQHQTRICEKEGCNRLAMNKGYLAGTKFVKRANYCSRHMKDGSYKNHTKDYCENRDGRLDFKCKYKNFYFGTLAVDHKNGDHQDNRPKNLQTLCHNCHAVKTQIDYHKKNPSVVPHPVTGYLKSYRKVA
jgi:hypothetical protein